MLIMNEEDLVTVADHINPERQGWKREVTVKWEGHKIRAVIDRDSYDFQTRIRAEVWSPATLSWNTVRSLSGVDHPDLPGAYTLSAGERDQDAGKRKIFAGTEALVEELIAYAQEVLS